MDRKDRAQRFSVGRKIVDCATVRPVVRHLEKSLLRSGSVLALSHYTRHLLDDIAEAPVVKDVLPMPVDSDFFSPARDKPLSGRIGFSGRLKNLELLLVALHYLRRDGHAVRALLIGGDPGRHLRRRIQQLGISDDIELCSYVSVEMLRDKLRTLDVFVVPSHQEGLCIAALEAMACGCPVVSTRCGGPEEFVLDDETGFLIHPDPAELADAILRILRSPNLQQRLGAAAREKVMRDYSVAKANSIFWKAFEAQFATPDLAA
jgi:glycosyltransferase involved in cell wall biosynthesis